jgi:zinc protease
MRKLTRALSALAVSGAVFFGFVAAGETAPVPATAVQQSGEKSGPKASQFELSNGLKIVVIEDHRAPVVTHMLWFRVGGTDDPPGLSGAAHLFEHLMFKGTKNVPPGELSKTVARNGGQDNAFTTYDYTAYFQRIAKDRLPLMMELEADRMVNLDLSEMNVLTERDVVLEERRLRIESDPGALASEQLQAALQLSHPYGRPVIGWMGEISTMTRDQAIDFYKSHYAPNNATLVVAGDVTPEEVRRLAEEKYGKVERRMLAPRPNIPLPPRLAEARLEFSIPGTRVPQLIRYYRMPSYTSGPKGTAEALDMLSAILGGGPTSRLYQTLVVDKKLASEAGAYYSGYSRGPGSFAIYATPRDGVSFDTLETAMDQVIRGMTTTPPEAGEFERAKTRLVAEYTYQQDNQMQMAQDYGTALSIGMTLADVEDWPNRIRAVQPADVRRVAQAHLLKEESVTGRMQPRP